MDRYGATAAVRRLVVVSYHFPPDRTVGARRWARFAEILGQEGWKVDVVAAAPDGVGRSAAWAPDVAVHYVPAPALWRVRAEARALHVLRWVRARILRRLATGTSAGGESARYVVDGDLDAERPAPAGGWRLGSVRGWLRMHWAAADFAVPRAWGQAAARVVSKIAGDGGVDVIVSSAPPHPAHTPVARMARRLGIPFVMDMRDPWSLAEGLPEHLDAPLWRLLAKRYEAECVASAALVIANTPMARESLVARYPAAAPRIISILNGSDDEPIPSVVRPDAFVIAYAGTVYMRRDPLALLKAVARLVRKRAIARSSLRLRFMGDFGPGSGCPIAAMAAAEGVAEFVEVTPRGPREDALRFLASATVITTFPGFNLVSVPAKVFESVEFEAWLLALSPAGSATADLLHGTDAVVVAPSDTVQIAAQLEHWYDRFCQGERPSRPVADDRLSRRVQAQFLADVLERLAVARGAWTGVQAPDLVLRKPDSGSPQPGRAGSAMNG